MIALRRGKRHGACVTSWHSSCAISLMLLCAAGTLSAAPRETIPRAYRQIAAEFGLPATVFYAAALTASGRALGGRGSRPWPWTLTFKGRRYHYPTRAAAHRALTTVLARGGTEVRVGLAALPWQRYAAELGGPWAALDPHTTLRIAAARLAPHLAARSAPIGRRTAGEFDQLIARLAPRFALYVALTRFAAQQLYAPERLLRELEGVYRVPVSDQGTVPLIRTAGTLAEIEATPLASWADETGLYVRLRNLTSQPVVLDPRTALRGEWLAATFQHARLFPAGHEADTTAVYLISARPFADALGPVGKTR